MSTTFSTAPSQRVIQRLLVQVRGDVNVSICDLTATGASGLMCTGAGALTELRRLSRVGYAGTVQADLEYYILGVAAPSRPMALEDDGLIPVTLEMRLQAQRNVGVNRPITPTRFMRAGDDASVRAAVELANELKGMDLLLHIPLDARWLDGPLLPLVRVLSRADHTVALTLAGQFDPLAKKGRAVAFRQLISSLPGCWLVRVDPLVALDGLAHGAACAAVGVTGGLRHSVAPGEASQSSGFNPAPGVFLRDMMSVRNSSTVAAWYANYLSPTCSHPLCGDRPLDSFYATPQGKAAAVLHNAHSWVDLATELFAQPASHRAEWLHGVLEAAMLAHDWLPGTAGVQVKPQPLLAAYVGIGP